MEENQQEKQNLFQLIESWEEDNIKIALQVIKKNEELKNVVEERYRPLLDFVEAKSLQSIKSLPKKLNTPKFLAQDWQPDTHSIDVLKSIPIHHVKLENKSLTSFPKWLCYLTQLVTLNLGNADNWRHKNKNKIKTIPSEINQLSNLKELFIPRADVKNIPKELGELQQLETLDLQYNEIIELPNLSQLTNLKYLNLFINQLTEVKGLETMTQLRVLHLGANRINKLDDVFGNLKELRELSLASNRFTVLYDSICFLEYLWKLDIYKLPLKGQLPPHFYRLKHLQFLRIDGTGIEKLPTYFQDFQKLKIFRIETEGKYFEFNNTNDINTFIIKHSI